jgi:hypothetical protein
MSQKDGYRIYAELLQWHPSRRRETSFNVISRMQPCERRRARGPRKGSSGRTFFSKFTSPEQSYATALSGHSHQQPQAPQRGGKSVRHPVQNSLLQEEFQKTDLSVQASSSCNNGTAATIVHQIMTELSGALSQEDRVMVITKMVLNLT